MIERAGLAIDRGAVEALGEVQNAGNRIFRYWQRIRRAARGSHYDAAAPQVTAKQVAGARLPLMKPFQPRCSGAQSEWKGPSAEYHLRLGEETVALLAGARPRLDAKSSFDAAPTFPNGVHVA